MSLTADGGDNVSFRDTGDSESYDALSVKGAVWSKDAAYGCVNGNRRSE